jgi:hypothetical protein
MKASHQAFLKFATCGACRLTIAGLGIRDQRGSYRGSPKASITIHSLRHTERRMSRASASPVWYVQYRDRELCDYSMQGDMVDYLIGGPDEDD